jgi:hypothetical protein
MKPSKKLLVLVACVLVLCFISVTALLAQQTITGTVAKKGADYVIVTEDRDYIAVGGGIDKLVGKKVKATGDLECMLPPSQVAGFQAAPMRIKIKSVEEVK